MADFNIDETASTLARLRQKGGRCPAVEIPMPPDRPGAIATQKALIQIEAFRPKGWKIVNSSRGGLMTAPMHPMFQGVRAQFDWRAGAKIEVEIGFTLGQTLPVRVQPYSRDELVAAISETYLGVELLFGAVEELWAGPPLLFLADRLGNSGYAVGPVLQHDFWKELSADPLNLLLDDASLFAGEARHPKGDILAWVMDYLNYAERGAAPFTKGAFITTGSLCGAISVPRPGTVTVAFGGHRLEIEMVQAP